MSSHQLNQVQRICTRVGIMAEGKIIAEGLVDQLSDAVFGAGQIIIEVELAEITSLIVDGIKKIEGVNSVVQQGKLLLVNCQRDLRPQIAEAVVNNKGLLMQINIQSHALEDIYLKYFNEG